MIKAIIFDLDGVIIKSDLPTFRLLQRLGRKYGYLIPDSPYKKRIGRKMRIFVYEQFKSKIPDKIKKAMLNESYRNLYSTILYTKSFAAALLLCTCCFFGKKSYFSNKNPITFFLEMDNDYKLPFYSWQSNLYSTR